MASHRALTVLAVDGLEGNASVRNSLYDVRRGILLSPLDLPYTRPPWGALTAIDLDTGQRAWEVPLGTTSTLAPLGIALPWGTPNLGGAVITRGGLVFIGAAMDNRIRAFSTETGHELWAFDLPAGGQASPMTYTVGNPQLGMGMRKSTVRVSRAELDPRSRS